MREILFRGKQLYNIRETDECYGSEKGTWRYGSYVYAHKYRDGENGYLIFDNYGEHPIMCDKNTIGQFTGKCDKNGKKIFEGDVCRTQSFGTMDLKNYKTKEEFDSHKKYLVKECKCIFDDETHYHTDYFYLVKWELNGFYPFADSPENCRHCGGAIESTECEVIGNIYDNPELLEVV